ncbi:aminopeptidase [Candidatus Woesearchaeota archaeon]|nr:aminopeptidase [Candidatus Woesearchaeota archaeon]
MADARVEQLAGILVEHSLTVHEGSLIALSFDAEAAPLALACYRRLIQKGAEAIIHTNMPGFAYTYFKHATPEQLRRIPFIRTYEAKQIDGSISIGAQYNTRELSSIDPQKIALRSKVIKPISDIILKKDNWVLCEYPTHALAQEADLSLEEFEDFVYAACIRDWKREEAFQQKLKAILDRGKTMRIIGENTDLAFSIAGRKGILCCGHRNMPDGEVFLAPVENSAEGFIHFTYPAIFRGREVENVRLKFHKGKVIEASATKNEGFLKEMLATDPGASFLGECGIGTNFSITRHIKNILFDEKIGGTVHLALGMAYKQGGGKNESALHWDMIKDLRNGGKILVDGKVIQENGRFVI